MKNGAAFKVANVLADPAASEVRGPDASVHLQPQVMDLLVLLARRSDEVVTRAELIETIWQGYPGADQSLFNAASKLRQALEDAGGDRGLIRTVPKRGYKLAMPVKPVDSARPSAAVVLSALGVAVLAVAALILASWQSERPSDSGPPGAALETHPASVVVLPFESLSDDPSDEYFADGLTEEILGALARVAGIKVAGRTSSFHFKASDSDLETIGESLGVANVLSGSIRRADDEIRVTAQLVSIRDGFSLWSETYDRGLADIFDVQEDIAKSVVLALKGELLTGEGRLTDGPKFDPEVHQLYLIARGRLQAGDTDDLLIAERLFEQVLRQNPSHYLAIAGAHMTQRDLYWQAAHSPWSDYYAQSRRMLDQALSLAPESALVHTADASLQAHRVLLETGADGALGIRHLVLNRYMIDPARLIPAENSALRALELDPDSADALSMLALIRAARQRAGLDEVLALYDRALQTEPLARNIQLLRADTFAAYGRPDDSMREYVRIASIHPDYADVWLTLAVNAMIDGARLEHAFAFAEQTRRLTDDQSVAALTIVAPIWWGIGMQQKAIEITEPSRGSSWSQRIRRWMIKSLIEGDYEAAHKLSSEIAEHAQVHFWDFWAIADAIQAGDDEWALARVRRRFDGLVGGDSVRWSNLNIAPQLAYLRMNAGNRSMAEQLCNAGWSFLAEQPPWARRENWQYDLQCHAILGNDDEAISTIRGAVDAGQLWIWKPGLGNWLDRLRTLGPLLEHPEYLNTMDRIKAHILSYRDEVLEMERDGLPPMSELLRNAEALTASASSASDH